MIFDAQRHRRRSLRLKGHDYAEAGAYFVTVCTQGRTWMFGEVVGDSVVLNDAGRSVQDVWNGLPSRFPTIALDAFVVMPNHVHGIVVIRDSDEGAASSAPTPHDGVPGPVGAGLALPDRLGDIVRAFKSLSAITVNRLLSRSGQPLWQRNYYERVIRSDAELDRVRAYIANNPARWATDPENPAVG